MQGIAQCGVMLEHDKLTHTEFSSCGASVMLEHINNRCPKKLKVVLTKACYLLSEHCGNIALATIESVWDYALLPISVSPLCCLSSVVLACLVIVIS